MQRPLRAQGWNVATLTSAALLIGWYCYIVSRHRILWSDELFGWMLVSDPSWRHMVRAWNLGADGGGIGFYFLARLWVGIFGRHLLAFRAFSATGVFVGFAAVWFPLRRFYQPAIVVIALSVVWFDSPILLWQIVQTRFYGMLLACCACVLAMSVRCTLEINSRGSARRSTLVLTFLANLFLVSSHPFGVAYSGLLLLAALINDAWDGRKRLDYYAAVVLPWLVLIPSITALSNSAKVAKPWFWTTKPTRLDLRMVYRPDYSPILFIIALVSLALVLVSMFWPSRRSDFLRKAVSRKVLLIPGVLLFLVPAFFWTASQGRTSYFVDRYYCPFLIGVAILGTELLSHIFSRPLSFEQPIPLLFAAELAIFCFYSFTKGCMVPYGRNLSIPGKDFTASLSAMLPRGEPVVIQRADTFDLMAYYQRDPHLLLFHPLDWDLALSPDSPRWLVSATHEMENWKRAGYYSDDIVYSEPFLATHSHFVVVADDLTPWFRHRIATQPGWHLEKISDFRSGMWSSTVWQVSR